MQRKLIGYKMTRKAWHICKLYDATDHSLLKKPDLNDVRWSIKSEPIKGRLYWVNNNKNIQLSFYLGYLPGFQPWYKFDQNYPIYDVSNWFLAENS